MQPGRISDTNRSNPSLSLVSSSTKRNERDREADARFRSLTLRE